MKKKHHQKIKREFNKSYIPIIIASFVLVLLSTALVYVVIYVPDDQIFALKVPQYKDLKIGVINGNDTTKMKSLRNLNYETHEVNYSLVKDYYRNDIILNTVKISLINNEEFIIRNNDLIEETEKEFISKVNLKGNLEWLTIITDENYKDIKIEEVLKHQDEYYLVCTGTKGKYKHLMIVKLDNKGTIINVSSIKSDFTKKIYKIFQTSNNIIVMSDDIELYYINYDLKLEKEVYKYLSKSPFGDSELYVYGASLNGNNLVVLVNVYDYYKDGTEDYILDIDINKKISSYYPVKNISNSLNSMMSRVAYIVNDKILYKVDKNKLLAYSFSAEYLGQVDYSNLELEEDNLYIISSSKETIKNKIEVMSVSDKVIESNTNFYRVYDFIDNNLNITKRYVMDTSYYYYNGVLLNTYIINNKIYELYMYGFETNTPAILITEITL